MDEKNPDRETLVSFLLVDRQVYDARLWAQQWLALAGALSAIIVCLIVFVERAATLSDLVSLGVVTLTGVFLSRRERRAKHTLLELKRDEFGEKTSYYRESGPREQ